MGELAREGLDAHRLSLLARRLKRADMAIEAAVGRAMAELVRPASAPATIAFDAAGYAGLPAEIALRLLGRALASVGDEGPVELAKLEALKRCARRCPKYRQHAVSAQPGWGDCDDSPRSNHGGTGPAAPWQSLNHAPTR